jgi:hypothetical protein
LFRICVLKKLLDIRFISSEGSSSRWLCQRELIAAVMKTRALARLLWQRDRPGSIFGIDFGSSLGQVPINKFTRARGVPAELAAAAETCGDSVHARDPERAGQGNRPRVRAEAMVEEAGRDLAAALTRWVSPVTYSSRCMLMFACRGDCFARIQSTGTSISRLHCTSISQWDSSSRTWQSGKFVDQN